MATINNLTGSWEAYNNRKIQKGEDPNNYVPEELWEFNYLVDLIQATKPHLDQITVILAMREGMRKTVAPRPRNHFIDLVLGNITERENQWASLVESMSETVNAGGATPTFPYTAN